MVKHLIETLLVHSAKLLFQSQLFETKQKEVLLKGCLSDLHPCICFTSYAKLEIVVVHSSSDIASHDSLGQIRGEIFIKVIIYIYEIFICVYMAVFHAKHIFD